jgi:hypothetical protein
MLRAQPTALKVGQECFPVGLALGLGEAPIDDLLFAIVANAECHQNRAFHGSRARFASKHDAVEYQHSVLVF